MQGETMSRTLVVRRAVAAAAVVGLAACGGAQAVRRADDPDAGGHDAGDAHRGAVGIEPDVSPARYLQTLRRPLGTRLPRPLAAPRHPPQGRPPAPAW